MLLQHREDLVQTVGADPCRRASRTGIAGDVHQGLQIHHQRARALTGHDRGDTGGAGIAEEQLTGVAHLGQATALHLKQTQLMGGTEAVLDGPQQAMTGEAVSLEGEHRIHEVFQHLRAGQHAFFGDVAHQQQRDVLAFRQPLQGSRTFTHLTDGPRRTGEVGVMQRLNAVDDRHSGAKGLQLLQHQFQIGFGQQLQLRCPPGKPLPAQLHLLR